MDKYDFQAQEVAHDSAMPGRLDPFARAVIAKALRECAADAIQDAANLCADYGDEGLATPILGEVKAILNQRARELRAGL